MAAILKCDKCGVISRQRDEKKAGIIAYNHEVDFLLFFRETHTVEITLDTNLADQPSGKSAKRPSTQA